MRAVFRLLIIGWLVHSACATSLAAASSLAEPAPLTLSIGISVRHLSLNRLRILTMLTAPSFLLTPKG